MKIAVAQIGARMHYAIPKILESAGMLEHLFTDVCASKGWPKLLYAVPKHLRSARLERLLTRVPKGIPREKITAFTGFGFEYARRLVRAEFGSERDEAFLWAGIEFSRLIRNKGFGNAQAVYCFNTAALEIFQHAGKQGIKRVLEQTISPRAIEERLLMQEQESFPKWERTSDHRYAMILAERERREWDLADVILCASEYVKNGIVECSGPAEKCVVIPYGIETNTVDIDRSSRIPGPLRVLTAGAVGLRKGSPYVMQAAELLNGEAEFRMLGSHHASPEAIKQLQMNVHAPGPVPRTTMSAHYAWADVFLLPSLCEGSATATYEAIFHGLPVICTPNTGSVIRDGLDGFIVPACSPAIIAERLRQLASDPDLLSSMSLSARKRSSGYTVSCYSKNLIQVLASAGIIGLTPQQKTQFVKQNTKNSE
jgi:glycosyltransferase involved in cell wall biosynthesis